MPPILLKIKITVKLKFWVKNHLAQFQNRIIRLDSFLRTMNFNMQMVIFSVIICLKFENE